MAFGLRASAVLLSLRENGSEEGYKAAGSDRNNARARSRGFTNQHPPSAAPLHHRALPAPGTVLALPGKCCRTNAAFKRPAEGLVLSSCSLVLCSAQVLPETV